MFKNLLAARCAKLLSSKNCLSISIYLMLALLSQSPAFSWFDFGHMEVAYVAYQRLNPKTKERCIQLLKLNPAYTKWVADTPEGTAPQDRDMMIFIQAATWPDVIKGDKAYFKDGTNNGHHADSPQAGQNIGYTDHFLHKYWHFTDDPLSSDGTPLPPIEKYNAQTQIETFRKVISSDASDELKSYDLTWLIHLVGDVHQPLHCAMRASKNDRAGDAGGNKVKLYSECGGPDNLHSYWDGLPGAERKPDNVPAAAKKLLPANHAMTLKMDEKDWIAESFELAKKQVYTGPIKNGDGPFRITSGYNRRAEALSKKRVELAGERLANLLNAELR